MGLVVRLIACMKKIILITITAVLVSCNSQKTDFELCGLGIKVMPYYFTGLKYDGEIYKIEKELKKQWIIPKTNNNGIAKVRFKVNCHGDIGDLHYQEYDTNYIQTQLNDSIEIQLMKSVSELSDWITGVDDDGKACNSHSFLSFRIENGHIIEILPK